MTFHFSLFSLFVWSLGESEGNPSTPYIYAHRIADRKIYLRRKRKSIKAFPFSLFLPQVVGLFSGSIPREVRHEEVDVFIKVVEGRDGAFLFPLPLSVSKI